MCDARERALVQPAKAARTLAYLLKSNHLHEQVARMEDPVDKDPSLALGTATPSCAGSSCAAEESLPESFDLRRQLAQGLERGRLLRPAGLSSCAGESVEPRSSSAEN